MADLKSRPIGATATLGRAGYPAIRSATGGQLDIVTGSSQPGFNPLDLLLASLAACMSMSARIAAREMGVHDMVERVTTTVSGEKAVDEPPRFVGFTVVMTVVGTLDHDQRVAIAHRAEEICTVSNSLAVRPTVRVATA
ncbi:MAG: OsmC family protein [Rhizobium rhizophilum]|uniref:OsmC family protein n=1 Tax=Rhizobium rhizophilum TaxID=1850373 RepID=UPI0039191742